VWATSFLLASLILLAEPVSERLILLITCIIGAVAAAAFPRK
jgi:hypothetical protein